HQDGLASELVTEMTEDDAAERTGDEPESLCRESHQQRCDRIAAGEEERAEDGRGKDAVDREVVPLEDGAGHAAGQNPLERSSRGRCAGVRWNRRRTRLLDGGHVVPFGSGSSSAVCHSWRVSLSPHAREQQVIMVFPAARSALVRTRSRWSTSPSRTGTSQAPQIPSSQSLCASMLAARSAWSTV